MTPVPKTSRFYGIANFFNAVNGLGLVGRNEEKVISPDQIRVASEAWCATPMSMAKASLCQVGCVRLDWRKSTSEPVLSVWLL